MKKHNFLSLSLLFLILPLSALYYQRNQSQQNPGFTYKIKHQQMEPKSSLFKIRAHYTKQQMREYNVQQRIKELQSQGKTPEEISDEFIFPSSDTLESKESSEKLGKSNKSYDQYAITKKNYEQNPSSDNLAAMKKAEKEWHIDNKMYTEAFKKKRMTPEYRAAYPHFGIQKQPTIWAPKTRYTTTQPITPIQSPQKGPIDRFIDWVRGWGT